MFNRVLVWALAGPLKDIHRVAITLLWLWAIQVVAIQAKVQSLFHRTREFCFSWSERVLQVPFWQTPDGLSCAFYWEVASVWSLYHTGLIGGVLQRWLFFWKVLLSPQRNAGALSEWPSGSWSPPLLRSFSSIDQFGWAASSRKSPGGSKLLQFTDDGGHCASIKNCLGGLKTIPWTSRLGLCSDILCICC